MMNQTLQHSSAIIKQNIHKKKTLPAPVTQELPMAVPLSFQGILCN
jgi:hypothetical protein